MSWWIILIICGAIFFVIFIIYIYKFEPFNFQLNDIRINLALKRSGRKGKKLFTILHLSDFHLRKAFKGRRLFKFIQTLKDEEYDLIFITGDMVESQQNIEYLAEMLSSFKAMYGKYAVLGVHDHFNKGFYEFARNMFKRKRNYSTENDTSELGRKLKEIGVEVLHNDFRKIDIPVKGMEIIELIGLGDPIIEKLDLRKAFSGIDPLGKNDIVDVINFKKTRKDVFEPDSRYIHRLNKEGILRLVLLHTPDAYAISTLYNKNVDIIFSGHTHGGQVRLPIFGALISGCRIWTRYASGLFYFKRFVLHVSKGLGEGKYSQFRCYCPPEAVKISVYGIDKDVENF